MCTSAIYLIGVTLLWNGHAPLKACFVRYLRYCYSPLVLRVKGGLGIVVIFLQKS
uniref:Uncharacterized protein n=1 Tax=Anguilla anguilla TaxID=7936 RepID=A0A0E9TH15_ANGAN